MNHVLKNRSILSKTNYVLKADISTEYWVGLSKSKIIQYEQKFGENFNIIIFGGQHLTGDFYIIPYNYLKDAFTQDSLYPGRQRWIADIKSHTMRFRKSNLFKPLGNYYSIDFDVISKSSKKKVEQIVNDYAIENALREVTVRLKQSKFRKDILSNFESKCCITGVSETELLVASHIIPWSAKIETRLDPRNGLCLLNYYDRLFDKGYFTLSNDLRISITKYLRILSPHLQETLTAIKNLLIRPPVDYDISLDALAYHRRHIFNKFRK